MHTSNRDDRKLENTVKQSRFKHLGEIHKEWTEVGVTTLRHLQEKGYEVTSETETSSEASYLVKEKKNWTVAQCSKVLFSDESQFCIAFVNQGPRVWRKRGEAQNPCCLKSSVKFPQSVMNWAVMSSAGVGPPFSEVHSQRSHLPRNLRALHASFCWQALWRCWFHFPAGLATCPHCQRYQKLVQWPWFYCAWLASKLAWPEPHRFSIKRKTRDSRPNNADDLKATYPSFHYTWAVPQADCIHATSH